MNTLLMLDGGHKILLKGQQTSEAQRYLSERLDVGDNEFAYFQPDGVPANTVIVEPRRVVALIGTTSRSD
jgi:hypothetical protein